MQYKNHPFPTCRIHTAIKPIVPPSDIPIRKLIIKSPPEYLHKKRGADIFSTSQSNYAVFLISFHIPRPVWRKCEGLHCRVWRIFSFHHLFDFVFSWFAICSYIYESETSVLQPSRTEAITSFHDASFISRISVIFLFEAITGIIRELSLRTIITYSCRIGIKEPL